MRQEITEKRTYSPGPIKARTTATDWAAMPDWALLSVRDVQQLSGLSRTALEVRIADGRFPKANKHGKDRIWSLGSIRRWCQSITEGQS